MRLPHHVARLVLDVCRFSFARRQFSLLLVVVVALAVVAVTVASQAAAPFMLYPFI